VYLYSFDTFAWHDKVFHLFDDSFSYKPGDLVLDGERVFCVLWSDVAFQEQYTTIYKPYHPRDILEKSFFSSYQLALLHFIVSSYYSTYKAVIKLLLPPTEIVPLLSYKSKNKKSQHNPFIFHEKNSLFVPSESKQEGQQLILIPDLWTGYNMFDDVALDQSTVRYSSLTALQMTKIFRWTKQGQISTLMTTFAGIFHDRKNLQRILFIQPDKRYYQHQQDPRYKVPAVIDFIAAQTGAELVKWG
jgi:primosomal protein N'